MHGIPFQVGLFYAEKLGWDESIMKPENINVFIIKTNIESDTQTVIKNMLTFFIILTTLFAYVAIDNSLLWIPVIIVFFALGFSFLIYKKNTHKMTTFYMGSMMLLTSILMIIYSCIILAELSLLGPLDLFIISLAFVVLLITEVLLVRRRIKLNAYAKESTNPYNQNIIVSLAFSGAVIGRILIYKLDQDMTLMMIGIIGLLIGYLFTLGIIYLYKVYFITKLEKENYEFK